MISGECWTKLIESATWQKYEGHLDVTLELVEAVLRVATNLVQRLLELEIPPS